jgi:serine/threonine protein kinase
VPCEPDCIRGTIGRLIDDAEIRARERVGTVLDDKWSLERLLGVGGMAAVYEARHRNGARAALKVLHGNLSRVEDVRERFRREGYAANSVEHPGAVKVLDDDVVATGPDAGTAYLVMELLDGESLQDRIERAPPVGEREFLAIADSVLDVLEKAHSRGVVHRDLKPENLFLMGDIAERDAGTARVKVLDFGLARLQGQAITSYGLALGTPSFMSPEQAAGRIDEVDGRSDIFALAATGFRLRTGRRIHEGANAVELVTKMANVAAPKVRSLAPEASEAFARIVDRALQFKREDRYESAAAMRADVRRALAELDPAMSATQLEDSAFTSASSSSDLTLSLKPEDEQAAQPLPQFELESLAELPSAAETARADESRAPSVRLSRHRSILPWLALVVFAGVGAELWFGSRKTPVVSQRSAPAAASAVATAPGSEPSVAEAPEGGADTGLDATRAAPPASSPNPPAAARSPAVDAGSRFSPHKAAPGKVHKRQRNRHPN